MSFRISMLFLMISLQVIFVSFSAFSNEKEIESKFQIDYSKVDQSKFINETQIMKDDPSHIKLAWWIPNELWKIIFSKDSTISENDKNQFIKVFEEYTIIVVVEGKLNSFLGVEYVDKDSLANSLELIDRYGNKHKHIPFNYLDSQVQLILTIFKPIMKNMIGQMGENMQFFVFKDKDLSMRIFDPLAEGTMKLNTITDSYDWELPIGSLLPEKRCPEDGKLYNGAWKYCPIHGEKLEKVEQE